VDEPSVSKDHARFCWRDEEGLKVTDQGATNRKLVNGIEVKNGEKAVLRSGYEVTMGAVRAVVVAIMGEVSRLKPAAKHTVKGVAGTEELVVVKKATKAIYKQVAKAAEFDTPVLVLGETGTRKEHVAVALHAADEWRREKPFVTLNCGSILANLVESIAFRAREKAAFSGATARRPRVFERVSGECCFWTGWGSFRSMRRPCC
jgi:transcriptional regulator with AAA-type ATPase domain